MRRQAGRGAGLPPCGRAASEHLGNVAATGRYL